jgi:threonine synthase
MDNYFYRCFECKREFPSKDIEGNLIYLCPFCGSANKNFPLKGVLLIEYDYSSLKKKLNRKSFLEFQPGEFWKYPQLWPLKFTHSSYNEPFDGIHISDLQKIHLNKNPLLSLRYEGKEIQIFDDTKNPTYSFKDRASIIVALKAVQKKINSISAASTGNAGSSIAGICASLGLTSRIFVPESIPEPKRIQIQAFSGEIYLVKGDYDAAFDLCLEISKRKNWFNRNTAYNPLTIEGKKSAAYDIFISSGGSIPDLIFIPVGDGVIYSGIFKGFKELFDLGFIEKLPILIAVQAQGSKAMLRFLKSKVFEFKKPETVADSISAGAPRNLFMASRFANECGGFGIEVTDFEILEAQKESAQKFGLLVEPSCASTLAAYKKLLFSEKIEKHQKVLLLFTGSGLKDIKSLMSWNPAAISKTPEDWLEALS